MVDMANYTPGQKTEKVSSSSESKNNTNKLPKGIQTQILSINNIDKSVLKEPDKKSILEEINRLKKLLNNGGDKDSIMLLINKELDKIDSAFKTAIENIFNGKKTSPSTKDKDTIIETDKGIDGPATGRGSFPIVTNDSYNSDGNPKEVVEKTHTEENNEEVEVDGISVEDLDLMISYLNFKGEESKEGKFFIEYLNFIKNLINSTKNVDKQLIVKKYFGALMKDTKKIFLEYMKTNKLSINSISIKNYKIKISKEIEKTKKELEEAKNSIFNYKNIKKFGENSFDIIGYRYSLDPELKESRERIYELEKTDSNKQIISIGKKLELAKVYGIEKKIEYDEQIDGPISILIKDNWNFYKNKYKNEEGVTITDIDLIIEEFKNELNIKTKKTLEESFNNLKLQLLNSKSKILKIPGTDKTILFKTKIDRNKAILSAMYLYKGILEDPEGVVGHIIHGIASIPGMYGDLTSLGLLSYDGNNDIINTFGGILIASYIYASANRRGNAIVELSKNIPGVNYIVEKAGATPYLSKTFQRYKELKDKELEGLNEEEKNKISNEISKIESQNPSFNRYLEEIKEREINLNLLKENATSDASKTLFEEFKSSKNLLLKTNTKVYFKKLKELILITEGLDSGKYSAQMKNNFFIKHGRNIIYNMTNFGLGDLIEHYSKGESKLRFIKNIYRMIGIDKEIKIYLTDIKIHLKLGENRELIKNNKDFVSERINKLGNKDVKKITNTAIKNTLETLLSQELKEREIKNISETITKVLKIQDTIEGNKLNPELIKLINEIINTKINSENFKNNKYSIIDRRINIEFLEEIPKISKIISIKSNAGIIGFLKSVLNNTEGGEEAGNLDRLYNMKDVLSKLKDTEIENKFNNIGEENIMTSLEKIKEFYKNYETQTDTTKTEINEKGTSTVIVTETKKSKQDKLMKELLSDLEYLKNTSETTISSTETKASEPSEKEKTTESAEPYEKEILKLKSDVILRMKIIALTQGKSISTIDFYKMEEIKEAKTNLELLEALKKLSFNNPSLVELLSEKENIEILEKSKGSIIDELKRKYSSKAKVKGLIKKVGEKTEGGKLLEKIFKDAVKK